MKRYPLYKDSKVKWIGNVPEHWKCLRLFSVAYVHYLSNKDVHHQNLLSLSYGRIIKKDINTTEGLLPASFDGYQIVESGNIVLRLTDLQNDHRSLRVGLVIEEGIITSAYLCLAARDNIFPAFLYQLLHTNDAHKVFYSMGGGLRQSLDFSELRKLPIFLPPEPEQRAIVAFLDRAVEKIDGYIAAKEAEIEKLGTLKQSVIAKAVTQGLNPDAPMKDSGIDWLDMIPAHWNIHLIKQHFRIQKRIAGKEGYKVLSITQSGLRVKDISCNEGQMAANYSGYQFVYPGDFAMNHMDLITGGVGLSTEFGVTSPDYRVFELYDKKTCNPDYFLYIFQICYKRRIFYRYGRGAASVGRWRLPAKEFLNFTIPVPPIEEQRKIVECITRKTQEIDDFITGIRAQIEKLKVYKQRLISDVVTGKICVCDDFEQAN